MKKILLILFVGISVVAVGGAKLETGSKKAKYTVDQAISMLENSFNYRSGSFIIMNQKLAKAEPDSERYKYLTTEKEKMKEDFRKLSSLTEGMTARDAKIITAKIEECIKFLDGCQKYDQAENSSVLFKKKSNKKL